jgi:myo-inositol 2-dehydrogenase/D-chiro-inositol 1-dehydrogenase
MRVGIVGTGFMGQAHAVGWMNTDAQVVGFVGTNRTTGEALAAQHGWRFFDSFDAILPEVDVVDLCVPTHLHHNMTVQAARAGKHVICEKPIALTLDEGKAMIQVCKTAGVRLFIGMVLHFFPEYIRIIEAVRAGQIGNPAVIRMTRASYRPKKPADNWFLDESKSGGMMLDLMIHDLEFARSLAGEVERVYAKNIRASQPDLPSDHALVLLRFRSGAIGHIEGSWAYPVPMFVCRVEVAGDAGLIEWDNGDSVPIRPYLHKTSDDASDVALPSSPLLEDPFTAEVKHFWDALKNDQPFIVTPDDALAGLQIALAARQSAQTGQPVTLAALNSEVA